MSTAGSPCVKVGPAIECRHEGTDVTPTVAIFDYHGTTGIRLVNAVYEAIILPAFGANLVRLFHRPTGTNILREPGELAELTQHRYEYGTPVLFFPNRIADGCFVFDGRQYRFPVNEPVTNCHLHGFLHAAEWQIEDMSLDSESGVTAVLRYDWGVNGEELQCFQHPCRFTLRFAMTDRELRETIIVENTGRLRMPLGFGYHTSFALPFSDSFRIVISLDRQWEMSDRHIPTGVLRESSGHDVLELAAGTRSRVFGHYTLAERPLNGGDLYGVLLQNLTRHYQVRYSFDKSFNNLVVWNRQGEEEFICIEPQTCAINGFNLRQVDPVVAGRRGIEAGKSFSADTALSVEPLSGQDTV